VDAAKAAKKIAGQFANFRPDNATIFLEGLGELLEEYPLGLVEECASPVRGVALATQFLSLKSVKDWCDARMQHYQTLAAYQPPTLPPPEPEPDYSSERRESMLKRLQNLMHGLVNRPDDKAYKRPIGRFEKAGDKWNRRLGPDVPSAPIAEAAE